MICTVQWGNLGNPHNARFASELLRKWSATWWPVGLLSTLLLKVIIAGLKNWMNFIYYTCIHVKCSWVRHWTPNGANPMDSCHQCVSERCNKAAICPAKVERCWLYGQKNNKQHFVIMCSDFSLCSTARLTNPLLALYVCNEHQCAKQQNRSSITRLAVTVPTIYKQNIFSTAGPQVVAGLAAVCAVVCFV